MTMEATPRILELREDEAQAVNHAYGTTGLITELEMPLAPAWDWIDLIVAFPCFMDAVRFGYAVAPADGIVKQLVTRIAWPTPDAFRPIRAHCPDGQAILIAMVAEQAVPAFKSLLSRRHASGTITYEQPPAEAAGGVPLYEFIWNHTTLQMLKRDRGITYLQALHPAARLLESVAEIADLFADEVTPHLEFLRVGGQVTASACRSCATRRRNGCSRSSPNIGLTVFRSPTRTGSRWRTASDTSRSMPTNSASSGTPIRMVCSTPGRCERFNLSNAVGEVNSHTVA